MESNIRIQESVRELGPWFHNFHLPGGVQTAPDHFLGDFPARKWAQISPHIPADLSGWTALDIGCNAGFYSFELARRGAKVIGIDSDERYLAQARWLADEFPAELSGSPEGRRVMPEFRRMQVHDLARMSGDFDIILFMGVFYHLRYPQLALDTIAAKTRRLLVFQTLTMNDDTVHSPDPDYPIEKREIFDLSGWPKMAFVEKRFSRDPTNWWVPNHSAVMAMLRSSGMDSITRVAHEMYFCRPPAGGAVSARRWPDDEWKSAVGTA